MHKFSSIYINCVSLILSVIIFVTGNFIFENHEQFGKNTTLKTGFSVNQEENVEKKEENQEQNKGQNNVEAVVSSDVEIKDWSLEIPKIDLKAPIIEGTAEETLNKYVGHFEETSTKEGTIGLARSY